MRPVCALCFVAILAFAALPAAAQSPPPPATPSPAAAPAPAPLTAPAVYYEKLTVVLDGKADGNGTIQLRFQPTGGEAKLVTVNVLAKTKAKDIAKDLWKELTLAGGNSFKVKLDGKEVKIKQSSSKGPKFALTIVGQSVTGVSVATER
jgi:hypothetical protein